MSEWVVESCELGLSVCSAAGAGDCEVSAVYFTKCGRVANLHLSHTAEIFGAETVNLLCPRLHILYRLSYFITPPKPLFCSRGPA